MRRVPDNPYHQIPYSTFPMAQTHPDRLASVATLFGMTPAPVDGCRVLEVGCGNGSNLVPMAYGLPGSRFTGVDLASDAIAQAQMAIGELDLANLEFIAMDLSDIGSAMGEFDYIIAHGVYSWVPDDVRSRLLSVCRERLAPQGVAFISYNALPGRHMRIMLREMMLYHTRNVREPRECIEQARSFLAMLRESHLSSAPWRSMIEDEIERMLNGDIAWLFHDDLAPINDSFYFRDFATRAAEHGLQYLGDAQPHLMFDPRNALEWLDGDVIEREQYLDFLYFRRFRQTLLCHAEVDLRRPAGPDRMDRFSFSSPAREIDGQIEGLHSVRITPVQELVARVASAMGEVYPLPVGFDELLEYADDRKALSESLFALIATGFAEFHVHDFPCEQSVTERPRASRLARWQNAKGALVTRAGHGAVQLDAVAGTLLQLLDGTRDFEAIMAGLLGVDAGPSEEQIRGLLPERLAWMAGIGLLEG